ncbi:MAG: histidine kinase dimerization/phospho-acceptor domain-containing protein [Gammaproteobacteria bacterium]
MTKTIKDGPQVRGDTDRRKDELLAILGYELRNPLAALRNAVEVLKRLALADPELQRVGDLIDRKIADLTRLADDPIDLSR